MTTIDTGVTGAKRTSFQRGRPRDGLRRLIARHPHLDADGIEALFNEKFPAETSYLREFRAYWFANNYRTLTRPPRAERPAAEAEASVARLTVHFLNMIVPGFDKPLGLMTFGECATAGGWFTKLSKLGKPSQKVGKVLSEATVAAVFAIAKRS